MTTAQLDKWLEDTAWNKPYWNDIHTLAITLKSDGCSCVPDTFIWSCLEHDCHYRTHRFINGGAITKDEADYCLRVRVQQTQMSVLKWPVSWMRWFGVAILFKRESQEAWEAQGGTTAGKKNDH